MKIAVTAIEPDINAEIDPRFGRCPYFLVVETDDQSWQAVENPNMALGSGAGIQSAQLMNEYGVTHVLTGNCGPKAFATLAATGIKVVTGCGGTVRDAATQFAAGQLAAVETPNVVSHFGLSDTALDPSLSLGGGGGGGVGRGGGRGMGGGGGRGMGRGGGRGMGGGRGRGMGGGGGAGRGGATPPSGPVPGEEGDELEMLRQQAEALRQQMEHIQQRIEQIERQRSG